MESMQLYVELVSNIDPRWEDMSTEKQLQQVRFVMVGENIVYISILGQQ